MKKIETLLWAIWDLALGTAMLCLPYTGWIETFAMVFGVALIFFSGMWFTEWVNDDRR